MSGWQNAHTDLQTHTHTLFVGNVVLCRQYLNDIIVMWPDWGLRLSLAVPQQVES